VSLCFRSLQTGKGGGRGESRKRRKSIGFHVLWKKQVSVKIKKKRGGRGGERKGVRFLVVSRHPQVNLWQEREKREKKKEKGIKKEKKRKGKNRGGKEEDNPCPI